MSNSKISALTSATTPLAGTETLPVVQSSTTKQVSVANLTAGRAVSALSLTTTSDVTVSGADTAYVYAYNPTAASGGVPKSSPRVGFYGSEWNSGAGAVSMSGYWQLQALANNVASPTSKLSLYLAGNGGAPAEVLYFGSDGNSVGYGSVTYIIAGGGNITLENTTAATSAAPQPSGKLILNSRSWNSANGNVGQTSYIRAITSTNNANPTVESIALAPSNGAGGQNEYFIFKGNGDQNLVAGNLVIGISGKGITTGSAIPLGFGTNGSTSLMTLSPLGSFGALGLGCTPGSIGGDFDVIGNQNGIGIGYSTSVYRRLIPQSTNVLSFASASNTATLSAAGAWTNASDARLKKNITDIKYGLDTVMATQPRSYNRKDVDGDFIGFIAQELKPLVAEVVHGSEYEQYTVDYGSLVAIAFKAIQELKAEIELLKGGK